MSEKEVFLTNLTFMMTTNNIPLKKIDNKNFRNFIIKHCKVGHVVPTSVQMRKYISIIYNKKHEEIINFIKNCESYAIIADETQDIKCRSVLNILVCPAPNIVQFEDNYQNKSFLIETIFLTKNLCFCCKSYPLIFLSSSG